MGLLEGEIHETKKKFAVTRGRKGTETKVSVPTMEREFNKLEKRLKELEKEGKDENDPEVKKI